MTLIYSAHAFLGLKAGRSMQIVAKVLGFFHWIGISHYINLLFVGFLIRSGLQVLSAHPKLYWNDACRPERAWLKFTRLQMPSDELWTASDEEDPFSPWIALPGGKNLGVGRHWHFFSAILWMLNGFVYVALLLGTGEWHRLVPTSWSVFPEAGRAAWAYLHLTLPPPGDPYNPLQQLTYAGVVFVLAPVLIATGAAMSPAVAARFPWYLNHQLRHPEPSGPRPQTARSPPRSTAIVTLPPRARRASRQRLRLARVNAWSLAMLRS